MTDIDEYPLGTVVTVYGEWDVDEVATDPNLVTLWVQGPDGVETDYSSMLPHTTPEPPIVKTGTGRFEADIQPTTGGMWKYRWEGIGLADGARDGQFWIAESFVGADAYTYDPNVALGQLRLLIDDRDLSNTTSRNPRRRTAIFSDAELGVFIGMAGNMFGAAALALRTIAINRALLVQRRQIGKTDVDYGTLRSDLLKAAKEFEEQAVIIGDSLMAPADGVVEHAWNEWGARDIIWHSTLRGDV